MNVAAFIDQQTCRFDGTLGGWVRFPMIDVVAGVPDVPCHPLKLGPAVANNKRRTPLLSSQALNIPVSFASATFERTEEQAHDLLHLGYASPAIAARATCQKLADGFGYDLHESPKANGRGIRFRMTAKSPAEGQA